ncbi:peptidyl-prolyl cis-trans isomerase [Bacillus suaedae]|uniref:Peptidyl-prolyl cis-trans isomerase n=1 Tax=Halalkalibacter suaedae TaxID=2822140 RepID=A0A940X011_9BACI|nr:peptidyl-prolyl cis-trans isomerase [Bacillus suaedae]MBP3952170.1 peptidyl-prolyl cis-trans isomerase [Bacillus suaedae]
MQEFVFFIEGTVKKPLTIDPTVWIFDERKVDLETYFEEERITEDAEELYTKAISAQWDKEILEGSSPPSPQSNGNKIKYNKQELTNGSFAMPLRPFLNNCEPLEGVSKAEIITTTESIMIDYSVAVEALVGFSAKGKPLREDGPVHLYFGDGSNKETPIRNIKKVILHK